MDKLNYLTMGELNLSRGTFRVLSGTLRYLLSNYAPAVSEWLEEVRNEALGQSETAVVGIKITYAPCSLSRSVRAGMREIALLQICVNQRCLVFQVCKSTQPPPPYLLHFLAEPRFLIVGIGLEDWNCLTNRFQASADLRLMPNLHDIRD
ncbi:hypothetical protein LUZ63_013946 [Rhynchospora breviuscula]|uniref:Uncharacterized protein n=1 Tax=Rhynchospora breviuscula TaxID=2022672 RepID=A0A9Q0C9G6_9POAL|nr:hypothetical protein LUZ63_013946 [Rhynchospora breviuscula]